MTHNEDLGIFHGLTPENIDTITKNLTRISFKKGEAIISEHAKGDNLFYINSGKVEISKDIENDDNLFARLSILGPGDFFGEMSLINDAPRSASAVALEDVELMVMPKEVFMDITFSHPIVMFNLIRTLSGRLRDTNDKFIELMNQMISKNRLMAIGMAASKIIHDIKSPFTVIVLTAQMIENLFPEAAEHTQNIISQTKLVDQMVRETLDFAKGTEVQPLIQQVDLEAYLQEIRNTYGTSLKGRDVELIIENNVNKPVFFDSNKMRRVLINLLKNSSEALQDQGTITIKTSLSAGWLQISMIDDGPGIPDEIRSELFQPFITHNKAYGTGLGLAICKKIVLEHRGRLEYMPVQPHGSRFDIRIPQNLK
ncbi:MAG TPA: cyclic nucleotide-binding domain-containing protein [Candidatus Cloacimonadota bacterium]|nr:cyclic nucleotide-binding domain-containing protein [Candidatus Cloacimonadota bacterium]